MSDQPPYYALDNLVETIQIFLDAPPAGTPAHMITTLADAIRPAHQILPPHLFFHAVEQAQVAVLITDLAYNALYANPTFKRIITTKTGFLETIKQTLGDKWQQLRANQAKFIDQEIYFEPGGYHHPRWFICSGTWFQQRNPSSAKALQQDYFLLVAKEITHIKRQQEEVHINALRARLAEDELTEGMRETLAGAVHQLQVPINLISAALEMLKRRTQTYDSLCATLQETLDSVNQAVERLYQCIPIQDKTLNAVAPVNFHELIHQVLTISTKRLLAEGIMVDWKPTPVLPSMLGNVGRLRGMLKQLIDNSIESMKKNHSSRELRIFTSNDSDQINLIIEDTGSGIPKELRFKVFEPFFTTKKAEKHAGMGLAAVQDVVNLHAGTIHIDPDYTEGSRFIIQFPTAHHRKS